MADDLKAGCASGGCTGPRTEGQETSRPLIDVNANQSPGDLGPGRRQRTSSPDRGQRFYRSLSRRNWLRRMGSLAYWVNKAAWQLNRIRCRRQTCGMSETNRSGGKVRVDRVQVFQCVNTACVALRNVLADRHQLTMHREAAERTQRARQQQ